MQTHFLEKARHLLTLRKIVTCKAPDYKYPWFFSLIPFKCHLGSKSSISDKGGVCFFLIINLENWTLIWNARLAQKMEFERYWWEESGMFLIRGLTKSQFCVKLVDALLFEENGLAITFTWQMNPNVSFKT